LLQSSNSTIESVVPADVIGLLIGPVVVPSECRGNGRANRRCERLKPVLESLPPCVRDEAAGFGDSLPNAPIAAETFISHDVWQKGHTAHAGMSTLVTSRNYTIM